MANTYTQIHIHTVFAVTRRQALIDDSWCEELYKYMTGIVQKNEHKLLAINGIEDHIHILIGMRPSQSLSDLMQDVKGSSSKWINERGFTKTRFQWQGGFGAFAYAKSQLPTVIRYIERQKEHHRKIHFLDEYRSLLIEYGVDYDERYIFKAPE